MPLALQIVPGLLLFTGSWFLPESPRWLVERGTHDDALKVVQRLHFNGSNSDFVQAEFQEIVEQIKKNKTEASKQGYAQVFRRKAWRRRLILGSGIWLMMNFTGINVRLTPVPDSDPETLLTEMPDCRILFDAIHRGPRIHWSGGLAVDGHLCLCWGRDPVLVPVLCPPPESKGAAVRSERATSDYTGRASRSDISAVSGAEW